MHACMRARSGWEHGCGLWPLLAVEEMAVTLGGAVL